MLVVARVTNVWRFRLPLPHLKLHFSSLSQAKLSFQLPYTLEKENHDFLPWLERKAGAQVSSLLSIGKSSYGRALFASKTIRAGDCILRVPYHVQLAPDNLPLEIRALLTNEIGHVAKLAIVVILEMKLGEDSDWAPYISRLPQLKEMHSTIFWSENELKMIRQSSLYQETINKQSLIEKEFFSIRQAVERFPEISERITYKDFMHAYALVSSRAWGTTRGESLIPFADFLNHDGNSRAVVLNDDDKLLSEVIADRDYIPGDQVLIRYGNFSNATLSLDFGFTVPFNIHDEVHIQFNIPHHDPLRRMKLEILQRHHVATNKDVLGFISFTDSFTIKEVRSTSEKGKGIPQSLRAFARVLCANSPQELNDLAIEAEQTDGRLARHPLRNISREIEAHQILIAKTNQLTEEYEASIKSLVPGNSPLVGETLALRRQMAHELLNGELRVLKSASAWLKNYCTTLTTIGSHL
ncbi:Rubisco LSMT methyltransferase [Parasponia andersonii]|uniref:Rubisco LSMT methyltransferase n=1 Tax=Parasponia andersonii TaxID=3476 RepID=A0A2P5DPZ8_PARAD|nr:Rubisco LSMT methyltransferase [Parasponia andersonii]